MYYFHVEITTLSMQFSSLSNLNYLLNSLKLFIDIQYEKSFFVNLYLITQKTKLARKWGNFLFKNNKLNLKKITVMPRLVAHGA